MTAPYYADDHVTLYHGDCLEVTEWLAADVLVTDPPYGMAYVSGYRHPDDRVAVAGDRDSGSRDAALRAWGDRPALVFGTWRVQRPAATRHIIAWHKSTSGPGMGDLSIPWGHAYEEVYVLGGPWVGLLEQLIECCPPGVIADPFAGGGSTLLAARALGRKAIGVELEERYCELIAKRLAQDVLDFGDAS